MSLLPPPDPTSPDNPVPYPGTPLEDKNAPTSPLGGKNGHPEKTPRDVNAVREYIAWLILPAPKYVGYLIL